MVKKPFSADMNATSVTAAMKAVADWQIYHPSRHDLAGWTSGALYAGMSAWAKISDEDKYEEWLLCIGKYNGWKLGQRQRPYHADDHCVGQMYLEMYEHHKDPKMIADIIKRFDMILAEPSTVDLVFHPPLCLDRWSWCDALFMAPPVWAKLTAATGERKYLDFMDKEWWATTDYLYDKEEHLFFRDSGYFDKREENGQKIFWSRGNGWVIAG
ncbi:MAG: glycoside hydrolase family 88 protein, partial [Sedimentisphaerales bacterium]|nr:glycoside hydrolase family 88 protein [Sedimentisphaerales bacterium]